MIFVHILFSHFVSSYHCVHTTVELRLALIVIISVATKRFFQESISNKSK